MSDANRTQALSADPNRTALGAPPAVDANRTVMGGSPSLHATQTIKPVQCPVCKTFNPAGVMFCIDCGLILDRALPDDAFGAPVVRLPVLVDETGREHPLRPGTTVVGREGDLQIQDAKVSRRHAEIVSAEGRLTLQDLGSTNGTHVGGDRVEVGAARELQPGDTVSFGGVKMRLEAPGAPSAGATQTLPTHRTTALEAAPTVSRDESEVDPQASPAAAWLVGEGHEIPLHSGPNTFGRKAENDVPIPDPYVSGRHGVIEVAEDGIFLTDIGSTNGTLLNEARLTPNMRTKLNPDDVIRLGGLEFRVRAGEGR
jgi:pSer/pThr/pTyr-binding forkhead associated (FHA) protein